MSAVRNTFVDYLTRYTTASPDHEAAFDEFLSQIDPPVGEPLRLTTRVERFLSTCFSHTTPPSVILTGNAGDGKTYLCRQIIQVLTGQRSVDWNQLADEPIVRDGWRLHVVKDLSELGDARGRAVLQGLADSVAGVTTDRYLIAANEGRLRAILSQGGLQDLYAQVDRQLLQGPESDSATLVVMNLNNVTTSSFVPAALRWMTRSDHWGACLPCPILERCPVRHNAQQLRQEHVVARVRLLYQLLEHLDIHVTVRDMLIHLAFTVTGNQRCPDLQRMDGERKDLSAYAYYENVWGGPPGGGFRRKASVVQHLDRLRVGDQSLFDIDDFIVSGGDTPERQQEHQQIFAPRVDLNYQRFAQDRRAYIEGGADRRADEEAADLMRWLPHCRRKLFFEWRQDERSNRLIPFLFLDRYLKLLRNEPSVVDQVRGELVRGLNRAFSGLYLTDTETLYVTTQYLHSTEQPRPLVRLTIPMNGIQLEVTHRTVESYDRDRPDLWLGIAPPPDLAFRPDRPALSPLRWQLNLLTFEYLMRLSHGGTYNILADECELSIRALKDQLLSTFAHESAEDKRIKFFVAEQRRYVLKGLHINTRDS